MEAIRILKLKVRSYGEIENTINKKLEELNIKISDVININAMSFDCIYVYYKFKIG